MSFELLSWNIGNFSEAFDNLKTQLNVIRDSEDWQIKFLAIEIVLVIFLLLFICIAWKVNGASITGLLNPDNTILKSRLTKTGSSNTTLNAYARLRKKNRIATEIPDMEPASFTECWKDEERMNFLFSAFPAHRSVNPHHWDTKLEFWSKLIQDMAMHSPWAYISWDNLFSHLTKNGKYPLGLQLVFDELLLKGDLVPTVEYTRDIHASESWVGWGLNWCVKKPVTWMADKVLSPIKSLPGKSLKSGQFVMIPALQHKCGKILAKAHDAMAHDKCHDTSMHAMNIISYSDLQDLVKDILKDTESLDLVLATLKRDRKVELITIGTKEERTDKNGKNEFSEGEKYVKFIKRSEKRVTPFSEVEIGVVHLIRTRRILEMEIEELTKEITQCANSAKIFYRNSQRSKAVAVMKKRRRLTWRIEKKEGALANVEQLLDNIHQCKTDKMVLETYRAGIAAYKDISKGLSDSAVQDTMEDLASVFDSHSDVSEALATNYCDDTEVDLSELEAELSALTNSNNSVENDIDELCNDLNSVNINKQSLSLPDVPDHTPLASNGLKTMDNSSQTSQRILLKN